MKRVLYLVILGLTLISCKKITLPEAPEVYLYSPVINQIINIPDSVYINFTVNSSREIKSVSVSIDNSNQVPVSTPSVFTPNENEFEISDYIFIETIAQQALIPPYYLDILIDDGEYSFHYFSKVDLIPRSALFNGVIAFNQINDYTTGIKQYDLNGNILVENVISGAFVDSEISNLNKLYYVATENPEKILAIDIENHNTIWEKDGIMPYPDINKLSINGNLIYQSMNIGRITGMLLSDGTNKVITPTLPDTIPQNICITENFIFTDFILRNQSKRGFYSFYASTGERFGRSLVDFNTQALFDNDDSAIIFGNSNSALIIDFDIINNQVIKEYNLSDYNIEHVCQIDINTYIFSDGSKIAIFNRLVGTAETIYELDFYVSDIKYENLSQNIYIASEGGIYIINRNGTEVANHSEGNNMKAIELLYEL